MKILTGNDLASGDVIWWTGGDWSRAIADAVDVTQDGDAILASESAALRVNVGYIVDAMATEAGPLPNHIKERIRAHGPTVGGLAINSDIAVVKA